MELFFDVETSGFISNKLAVDDPKQAWIMQIAYILSDHDRVYTEFSSLVTSNGRLCNPHAFKVHQISTDACDKGGMDELLLLNTILHGFFTADLLVAHNFKFDIALIEQYLLRTNCKWTDLKEKKSFCTMLATTDLCRLPQLKYPGKYKWPKLTELYNFLFDEEFEGAHDALADVRATRRCYYRLKELE